tara:strand:- start:1994 stop:2395 length:402 start_codon:yes stop_codon:yes gene_type:complete
MTDDLRKNRDSNGRFTKGSPGRPIGSKNKTPRAVLNRIKAMDEMAIQKLWEAVCLQEKWAIEYVLNKILPASRTTELEGLTPDDLRAAITEGDISPDEGKSLSAIIKNLKEIESLDEIKERLDDLEAVTKDES